MIEEKKIRGGKRPGAGRKKEKGDKISFRPDLDLVEEINSHNDKTKFINDCIRFYTGVMVTRINEVETI